MVGQISLTAIHVRTTIMESLESGTLKFNGRCKGNVDKAVAGINHIALMTAEPGDYDDCTMTLTDSSNNRSQPLRISPFEIVEDQS